MNKLFSRYSKFPAFFFGDSIIIVIFASVKSKKRGTQLDAPLFFRVPYGTSFRVLSALLR